VISRFSRFKHVYAFFDVSSYHYEVYPEELFHRAFPYFLYGNLFVLQDACFYDKPYQPILHSEGWPGSILPNTCVPALWSRRMPLDDGSGWGGTRRLIFDHFLTQESAKQFPHEFWNTVQSLGPEEETPAMLEDFDVVPQKMCGPRGTRLYLRNGNYISPFDEGYDSESDGQASLYYDGAVCETVHNGTTYYRPTPGIQQPSACTLVMQALELYLHGLRNAGTLNDVNDFDYGASSYEFFPHVSSFMPSVFGHHLSSHTIVPELSSCGPNTGDVTVQVPPFSSLYQNIEVSVASFPAFEGQDISSRLFNIGKVQDWINNVEL
jgi:hypothetical protein